MAPRRTARPVWAAALSLLCGCSSETTMEPVRPESEGVSSESENHASTEELRGLSREEIWSHGVARLGWHPEEPPEEWTKQMMIERFSTDAQYEGWFDGVGDYGLDGLGYGEGE